MKCQVINCENKAKYGCKYEGSYGKPTVYVYMCKEHYLNCWTYFGKKEHEIEILNNAKLAPDSLD